MLTVLLMLPLGQPLPDPALLFSLYALTSLALLAFHLWLAVRFSPGVTLGVGIVVTLLALILGSTGLGAGIWKFFPWLWARVVPFSEHVSAWPFLLALVVMGGVFSWLGLRASQREV